MGCRSSGGKPKWSDYSIKDPDTGDQFHLVEGSRIVKQNGVIGIYLFTGAQTVTHFRRVRANTSGRLNV